MTPSPRCLTVRALGLVGYRDALHLQEECVRARSAEEIGDTLMLVEHPPVLTAGRGTGSGSVRVDDEVLSRSGLEVVPVSRGGDVTWHGPGQLVGYPVCDLGSRGNDLHRFLRELEQGLLDSLKRFGIDAHRSQGRTGIWVGERKLASIGIAVRRWISYHGFALNVRPSLRHFDLIHPCGLRGVAMTSMLELLGDTCPPWVQVLGAVSADVAGALGYDEIRGGVSAVGLEASLWSDTALGTSRSDARSDAPIASGSRTGGRAA